MSNALKGICLLNIRPADRGQKDWQAIEKAGGEIIHFPMLESKPVPTSIETLPELLKSAQIAIFVSQAAVEYTFLLLEKMEQSWPDSITNIAIGSKTADSLKKMGVNKVLAPEIAESEHLLELACLQEVEHQTILLFRGKEGRALIEQELSRRNACLHAFRVYENIMPHYNAAEIKRLTDNSRINVLLITSVQAMENLFQTIGPSAGNWLKTLNCLVISDRLAKEAENRGLHVRMTSRPEQIVKALINFNKELKMAQKNEKKTVQKTPKPETQKTNAKKGGLSQFLASSLAFIALFTAFYTLWLNHDLRSQLQQQRQGIDSQLSQVQQQQTALKENMNDTASRIQSQSAEIKQQLSQFNQQLQQRFKEGQYSKRDWILLKARYYLELAQVHAHWNSEIKTTIGLLQQTDQLLARVNEQGVFEIRQSLSKELNALQKYKTIDYAGLLSKLDAASDMVGQLPLSVTSPLNQEQKNESSQEANHWRQKLKDSVSVLEKMVVVRRNDQDIKPLLSPLYVAVVRQAIILNLQEAQWAVLQNNDAVYHLTLQQAIDSIESNFDADSPVTARVTQQLKMLNQQQLKQEFPSLQQSLQQLNQLIQQQSQTSFQQQEATAP